MGVGRYLRRCALGAEGGVVADAIDNQLFLDVAKRLHVVLSAHIYCCILLHRRAHSLPSSVFRSLHSNSSLVGHGQPGLCPAINHRLSANLRLALALGTLLLDVILLE